MKRKLTLATMAATMTLCTLPQTATAQLSDQWQFGAVLYGYFPSISGKTTFPAGGSSTVSVDADTIIGDLNFAFMGYLEAQKGRWGMFTDFLYVDLDGSKSQTRDLTIGGIALPANVTSDLNLDLKGMVWTLGGSYRVVADRDATFDVLAGARMIDLKEELGWQFSANLGAGQPSRSGSSEVNATNWDGIVGVKGRVRFGGNREWFIPYYLDVGTGESDLTWQAIGGIGYSFHWGELLAGWRYLDYEFDATRIQDLNLNGPFVGVAFRW